jgi:glycosyltransferase involved in cell wall biosynthesis
MIRILVLIDTNIGGRAGTEQHLRTVVEHLDYGRFAVHVLQLAPSVPQKQGRIAGATFDHLPTRKLMSPTGVASAFRVLRHMRRGRYDCVLSFFETSDLLTAVLAPWAGVRARVSSRRDTGFRHSNRLRWLYRLLNRRFARVIAASEAIRMSLLAEGWQPERVRLIYNGVDTRRFGNADPQALRKELGIPRDAVVLGTVANLSPVKDHATAVEALRRLHTAGRPLHLVLAGDGPEREPLTRQAEEAGLAEYVHFLGRRQDVATVLAGVDVFVLASHSEGLSNALLEASAAGCPIVATAVGGNPEVVADGETGLLVSIRDPEALAGAVARLADDPALRAAMGAAGRDRVSRRFSLAAMVAAYEATIEEAVAETAPERDGGR